MMTHQHARRLPCDHANRTGKACATLPIAIQEQPSLQDRLRLSSTEAQQLDRVKGMRCRLRLPAALKMPRQSTRCSPPLEAGNTSVEGDTAKCCCSSATSPRRYDGEKVRKGTCVEMCANLAKAQRATTPPEMWACNPRANASTTKVGRTSWSYMSEADTIPICDRRKRKGAAKARDFAMVLRRSGIADWQNLQNMSVA